MERLEAKEERIRLDKYLAKEKQELSRSMIQKLIEEKAILVNGKPVHSAYILQKEDRITIEMPDLKEAGIQAQEIPLDIIYEDQDLIVVNKAKGMVVHPGNGNPDKTLVNALMARCKDRFIWNWRRT